MLFLLILAVGILAGGVCSAESGLKAEGETEAPCVELIRSIPAGTYTPGEDLTVEMRVESACVDQITSFGISEHIPKDWVLVRVEEITGSKPGVRSARGTLEFSWINVPPFPIEFRYIITPPLQSSGTVQFSGNAFYYIDAENELRRSGTTVTELSSSSPAEGEVLAEGEQEGEAGIEGEGEVQEGEQEGEIEGETAPPAGCCRVVSTTSKLTGSKTRSTLVSGDIFLSVMAGLGVYFARF